MCQAKTRKCTLMLGKINGSSQLHLSGSNASQQIGEIIRKKKKNYHRNKKNSPKQEKTRINQRSKKFCGKFTKI